MKWKLIVPISLISALSLGSVVSHLTAAEGLHYIAALNGDVRLKRRWWLGYRSANVGDVLSLNDWLRVSDPRSSATVLCNNISRWQVPTGNFQVSNGCTGSGPLVRDRTILVTRGLGTRGGEKEESPYLLSPRNTAVLPSQSLLLRWHPAPGAESYEVTIQSLSQTIWSTQAAEPTAVYPNLTELTPINRYRVTITTNTGVTSPESNASDILFWVLDAETVQALEADRAKITALALEGDAKTLALAHLYRGYQLYQQGIDVLETAIQANSQTAAIYQLQAELYQQIGLTRQAQGRYQQALTLANNDGNLGLQAEIQLQLGFIAHSVEEFEQAIAWLSAAATIYQALLDTNNPEVQTQLTELQELIQYSQSRLPEA